MKQSDPQPPSQQDNHPDHLLSSYDFDLPPDRIAQEPVRQRDQSRLLVLSRKDGSVAHQVFQDLPGLLLPGDLLVRNDTRVVPGRLLGHKDTGGRVEILILDYARALAMAKNRAGEAFACSCLIRSSKPPKRGQTLVFDEGLFATVEEEPVGGMGRVRFSCGSEMEDILPRVGRVPLPPYIHREPEGGAPCNDRETYQTVYARRDGAVAAPTAGLHFTPEVLSRLAERGVETATVTLHVGYGTFVPVREEDVRLHQMHAEWCQVDQETARAVNRAKADGRRVVCVGTTSLRTLEHFSPAPGVIEPGEGECRLFILPGYEFKIADALLTNFHLPRSTLLFLVSAMTGRETILAAYGEAVRQGYRFFSYGDAML
ncbi:MAG: tRNA preQ1(34) S-adenosylmethionine ribosyltransferase-isomerase QueA, partial [Pseudomonadota bacterium]